MIRWLFVLAVSLAACTPQARSRQYFADHPAEAARIVSECKTGATRGPECDNAEAGVLADQADKEMRFFKKSF